MRQKEKRTRAELATMVMDEIKKHPECAGIRGVSIIWKSRRQSYQANWDAAFEGSGPALADPKGECQSIAIDLQNRFDLGD